MPVQVVYETHSVTEDNEAGRATGWLPGRLSAAGRELAAELGRRRWRDGIAAVFSSDLARSVQTAGIAFDGTGIPVLLDWRLRECDYGSLNGMPTAAVHADRTQYLDRPYPGGESWRQATDRVGRFVAELPVIMTARHWSGQRVLVIGHVATRWGLEMALLGTPLEQLINREFGWQEGWEYLAR